GAAGTPGMAGALCVEALEARGVVTGEVDRLAAPARARDHYRAALTIARELERHGVTGSRRAIWSCPLARHLSRRSGTRVGVTRYEVLITDSAGSEIAYTIRLTEPPGGLIPIREFICQFDDHRRRFRWLDDNRA